MTAIAEPPVTDRTDFDDADHGFIGALSGPITAADGRVVFDPGVYSFLDAPAPDTVNPSLWRQSQLTARHGLYEVVDGIYQIRGYDISNMTLIEGTAGLIVVDPLVSVETAAAGLGLYRQHRGDRPVVAVIFTHSHADHFGGVDGIADAATPIFAPAGFFEHAVSENVYAGVAMFRRALYYSASGVPTGPGGEIGIGLGPNASRGTLSLRPPTVEITRTGQEQTIDGVRIVFQMTPGTEAPSEMNFYLPDRRALCMAENATHNLHNILTLRGAVVRDARIWSRYLNESIELFAADSDVLFTSHHWPTWGTERLTTFLAEQRDLYAYLHDQTLRLMNQGYTGAEIAEMFEMPPGLTSRWHTHGYYGSVSHNVKAIYQRYLGWYDGNPAHLWPHPPAEEAKRYVDCMGGVDAVVATAQEYASGGDPRFAVTLLNHAVFAEPDHVGAKAALASVYDSLAYGAECATWRNAYLQGATELRDGVKSMPLDTSGQLAALTTDQLLDTIAISIDGPRAWNQRLVIDWTVPGDATYRTTLSNGALSQSVNPKRGTPDLTLTLSRAQLVGILTGAGLDGVTQNGDATALSRLMSVVDRPNPDFAIVTP